MKFPETGGRGSKQGGEGGGLFVSLKDGDKVTGVFRGDPAIFHVHWTNGRSSLCPGKAECALCAEPDNKAKFRFKLNFLTKVDGVFVAKIFEGSYAIYKDLKELHESDYDLEQTLVHVSRKGAGTDTRYSVLPAKNNGGMNAANFATLAKIPLNPLKGDAPSQPEADDANNEDAPF